jgi:hypothetical protein
MEQTPDLPTKEERDRIVSLLFAASSILHADRQANIMFRALAACVRNPDLSLDEAYRLEREASK